ncbi:4Fe-4S binding protein [candidate division KSB1 bacterium]
MKKPKLRELKEAVTALWKGPYTIDFPKSPSPVAAEFRGKPEYQEEFCIGCGACSEVCPANAIEIASEERNGSFCRVLTIHLDNCVYCGTCVEKCTTQKGIIQSREFDLSGLNREDLIEKTEKEMICCEICCRPFTTRDHLLWIYHRLGSRAAGNWALILIGLEQLKIDEKTGPRDKRKVGRYDITRILCPECRRNVMLSEEWGAFD